jgi:hypothetical protein
MRTKSSNADAHHGAYLRWYCPETQRLFTLVGMFPAKLYDSKKLIETLTDT